MERHQHPTNNDVLRAPAGMTPDECTALAITRVVYSDGQRGILSYWRPSAHELELLNKGHPVRLCVMGSGHPPVSLGVSGDGYGQHNGQKL